MAAAAVKTLPKPLPVPPEGILDVLADRGNALWNFYEQLSAIHLGGAAQVNAPLAMRPPPPHAHDAPVKLKDEIHVQIHNLPRGAHVSAGATGATLHVDTGKGVPVKSGGASSAKSPPEEPQTEIATHAFTGGMAGTSVHPIDPRVGGAVLGAEKLKASAAHSVQPCGSNHSILKSVGVAQQAQHGITADDILTGLKVARAVGEALFLPPFLRNLSLLDWVHVGLGALSFIPEAGSIAAGLDGLVYFGQAAYAKWHDGDDAAAAGYARDGATDWAAGLIGLVDTNAGGTRLALVGGEKLLAGAVISSKAVPKAIVVANAVKNVVAPHVSQSVASGDGSSSGDPSNSAPPEGAPPKSIKGQVLERKKGGQLLGKPEEPNPNDNQITRDSLRRQNEATEILAEHDLKVERLPKTDARSPDANINGEPADVYSPTGSNVESWAQTIPRKASRQGGPDGGHIVVNLDGADATVTADDVARAVEARGSGKLKDLYVIDKNKVVTLYKFGG